MRGNNLNQKNNVDFNHESLSKEYEQALQEFSKDSKELQDKIQYFEYNNRDGDFYVFSYKAITGEHIDDIKQKYVDQYGGKKERITIIDDKGNTISDKELRGTSKIYLKIKRNEDRHPIKFFNFKLSREEAIYKCFIETEGWTPEKIRQIYQDQSDKIIPEEEFQLLDLNDQPYDESIKFKPGDIITVKLGKLETMERSSHEEPIEEKIEDNTTTNEVTEQTTQETTEEAIKEAPEAKISIFKEMIETQGIPLSRGDRSKPEISLTFDDGYGESYIRNILDTLRGSGIKATFFVLGECIKKSRSLWEQAVKDGHEICCHTYSHAYLSEGETTKLFEGHGIPAERRPGLVQAWDKNVKRLLGTDYYNKIKAKNPRIPEVMDSADLLETEILMREEEVRQNLGEAYLNEMKLNHPFFRFPGGCGSKRMENIEVLKKHGYLAIGWNDEPKFKIPEKVGNGDIPLFHFDQKNINALNPYISKIKASGKKTKLISELILQ